MIMRRWPSLSNGPIKARLSPSKLHEDLSLRVLVSGSNKTLIAFSPCYSQYACARHLARLGIYGGMARIRAKIAHKPIDPLHKPTEAATAEAQSRLRNA